jgi:hydrogenase maturation factor HypE
MGKPLNDEEQTITKKNKTNQNQKKNISKVQKIKSTIDLESLCLSSQIKIMTILESLDLESLSLSLDLMMFMIFCY